MLDASAEELYDEAPCGYLTATPDGLITRVNATFLRWTGYTAADLVEARRFSELLTAGGRIYHETHYAPLLRMAGEVRQIAVELVRADGSRLPVLVNSVLKRDADGTPLGIRTTVFDATERRRYERELLHARDRERAARERIEALLRVAATLAAAPDAHTMATGVVQELVRTLGAPRAGIAEWAAPASALRELAAHGAPAEAGAGLLRLPFGAPGRVAGELWLEPADDASVDDELRAFLRACADQVAVALERARLYEQARDVAHALQQSALIEPPEDPRVALAVRYEPGEEHLEVGGDWYDAFFLAEACLALVVGDVVGRGARAAGAMSQLRAAVRALAGAGNGPGAVLEQLDPFVEQLPPARYATMVIAVLELDTGAVTLACAGHPPPLLLRGAGPDLFLDGRSPPLGVPDGTRPEARLRLAADEGLIAYTDGLVERRRESIDVGLERLRATVAATPQASPAALAAALPDELRGPGAGTDDICVLALRRV